MARATQVLIACIIIAVLLAAWCIFRVFQRKAEANRVMADIIETWAEPKIKQQHVQLQQLRDKLGADHEQVAVAEKAVAAARTDLQQRFASLQLTPVEIEERLQDLRL